MNKKILFGCVAENNPKYLAQALRLIQSIRWFGGKLSNVDFITCVVDNVNRDYQNEFEKYNAKIKIISRFSEKHPHSNKLQLLQLPEIEPYDMVVLLDCDTIVVRDPSKYLKNNMFQAKIADAPTVPHSILEKLFSYFKIDLPLQNYNCSVRGERTIPYFNAGVLIFPKPVVKRLVPTWVQINRVLIDNLELLEGKDFFCEQVSLSLAIAKTSTKFKLFGNEMNFPMHFEDIEECFFRKMAKTDPVIIHYHWLTNESGYINTSKFPAANSRIIAFNQRLRKELENQFNNQIFWNDRYSLNPELGSGLGSRGVLKEYKSEILRNTVAMYNPNSILDIGCGDMEVSKILPAEGYLGIDISSVQVNINKEKYPNRNFVCDNFLKIDLPEYDLSICFDVLIHLNNREDYRNFVCKIIQKTKKVGIIAGFDSNLISDGIVFFHEPISETLRAYGATNIRQIGAYRNVSIFQFSTAHSPVSQDAEKDEFLLKKPVFIVGTMRSGTTLLADILGNSKYIIHCPFELKDIWSKHGISMASPKTKDRYCPQLKESDIQDEQREKLSIAFLERMAQNSSVKSKDAVFLNKNPHLCNKLPFVLALFPDARFIWTLRDLPQVVASLKKLFEDVYQRQATRHFWPVQERSNDIRCWNCFYENEPLPENISSERVFPGGDVVYLAEYWLESNLAISEFFKTLPCSIKTIVIEEELIGTPEMELVKIMANLNLPLELPDFSQFSLEKNRNKQWERVLNHQEIERLKMFIETNRKTIDLIAPQKINSLDYLNMINEF
jgi:hypothetical protein